MLPIQEEEIDVRVLSVELNPLLSGNEGKARAQFEQEQLQLSQDRVFEVTFKVMV
jgi:hypothetical protein